MKMKNFTIIGVAGYIAPRHLKAIKDTNNNLLAALDPSDNVGVIDSFFPKCDFFTEPERFDRHIEKLKYEKNTSVDYMTICTPNFMHDSHIRMALRREADAICEKPLVLNPWNLDSLQKVESKSGKKIWTVLQLRHHESIQKLKKMVDDSPPEKIFDIDLTYITSRGKWYYTSWKGDTSKSGGIATNIGVHFFDMLSWIFGDLKKNIVHIHTHDRAAGFLDFKKARVRWFLSINSDLLPAEIKQKNQTTYRSISIESKELEFSNGFNDLHTEVYKNILKSNGYGLEDARKAIDIVHEIRSKKTVGLKGDYHPFAKNKLSVHPFSRNL